MYIYVTGSRKVAGCLAAESISQAFPILTDQGKAVFCCCSVLYLSWTGRVRTLRPFGEKETNLDSGKTEENKEQEEGEEPERETDSAKSVESQSPTKTPTKGYEVEPCGDKYSPSTPGGGGMVCCSTIPQRARLGVSRIWVHPQHRRMAVATRLLDAAR